MAITDTPPVAETKWPRWAWFVAAVLAIVIGGGLGHWVATRDAESEPSAQPAQAQAIQPTVKPIVEPPASPRTSNDHQVTPRPAPEIEIQPESVKPVASPTVRHVTPKPKQKPKPSQSKPCNVYDHMDGC